MLLSYSFFVPIDVSLKAMGLQCHQNLTVIKAQTTLQNCSLQNSLMMTQLIVKLQNHQLQNLNHLRVMMLSLLHLSRKVMWKKMKCRMTCHMLKSLKMHLGTQTTTFLKTSLFQKIFQKRKKKCLQRR